jgi:hypothetical protein
MRWPGTRLKMKWGVIRDCVLHRLPDKRLAEKSEVSMCAAIIEVGLFSAQLIQGHLDLSTADLDRKNE